MYIVEAFREGFTCYLRSCGVRVDPLLKTRNFFSEPFLQRGQESGRKCSSDNNEITRCLLLLLHFFRTCEVLCEICTNERPLQNLVTSSLRFLRSLLCCCEIIHSSKMSVTHLLTALFVALSSSSAVAGNNICFELISV